MLLVCFEKLQTFLVCVQAYHANHQLPKVYQYRLKNTNRTNSLKHIFQEWDYNSLSNKFQNILWFLTNRYHKLKQSLFFVPIHFQVSFALLQWAINLLAHRSFVRHSIFSVNNRGHIQVPKPNYNNAPNDETVSFFL